jgi:dihydrofolate reductase
MKGTRRVSLIAAVAENGVIGRKGALPWRIPEDFRYYLDKVRDQIIILGRHCFYEADHPAALTIALSRNPQWQPSPLKVPSIHISHTSFSFFLRSWAVRRSSLHQSGGRRCMVARSLPEALQLAQDFRFSTEQDQSTGTT